MANEPLTRSLLRISAASLAFTALIAIVALLSDDIGEDNERILLSTLAVGIYAAMGAASASGIDRSASRAVANVGVAASVLGFVSAIVLIWAEGPDDDSLSQIWGILSVITISCAQATVILARKRDTDSELLGNVITATLVAIGTLAVMAIGAIGSSDASEDFARLFGVVAVLDAFGTALIPILRKMNAQPGAAPVEVAPPPAAPGRPGARVVRGQVQDGMATALASGATPVLQPTTDASSGATVAVAREPDGELVVFVEGD